MVGCEVVETFRAVLLDHDESHVVLRVGREQRVLARSECGLSPFVVDKMPVAVRVEVESTGRRWITRARR